MSDPGPSSRGITLITGASGGIGADLARVFARNGHDLALVARSTDKLEALAQEIAEGQDIAGSGISGVGRSKPIVISCDLAEPGAVDFVAAALSAAGAHVAILVNNAGFGLAGPVARLDPREQVAIVDLNVRAVLELTLRFLPEITAVRGKILNVGSIVSFFAGPGMAVYYASKAFLSAFSRALTQELAASGVTVTVLHPGLTATGFQQRAGLSKTGRQPARRTLQGASSLHVAETGYRALMAGRRAIVPGVGNKIATLLIPLCPDAVILPIVARIQRARL